MAGICNKNGILLSFYVRFVRVSRARVCALQVWIRMWSRKTAAHECVGGDDANDVLMLAIDTDIVCLGFFLFLITTWDSCGINRMQLHVNENECDIFLKIEKVWVCARRMGNWNRKEWMK